jgi:hypothetical protein
MRTLFLALAALSLLFVSSACSDKSAPPPTAPVAKKAPVYPAPCPKLRNCLNAFKAQSPAAAGEFEEVWDTIKAEYNKSPQHAANRCAVSLRGYATRVNVPMSCK